VAQSTGLVTPGATPDYIAALQQGLADLQSSVDALSNQVAQLTALVQSTATQTQYYIITTNANNLQILVNKDAGDLTYFAQYCPPLPEGSTPTTPDSYCATQGPIVRDELMNEYESAVYEEIEGYVQDNGTLGTQGMLHLYSLWLGESKRFFRAADSTKMQNLYDYWDATLTQAANLRMELFHQQGYQDSSGGQATIFNFVGNPDLSPPTTGTYQANQAANLKLMFPPVPDGTVINTKDRTMWLIMCPIQYNSAAWPNCSRTVPPQDPVDSSSPVFSPISWNGIAGWASPSLADMQSLVTGWSGSSASTWLTAQTEAVAPDSPLSQGFADIYCGGDCNDPFVWTSTPTGTYWSIPHPPSSGPQYYIMDLTNGTTPGTNSPYLDAYNSDNWIFLKRSLSQGEQYYWYQ
jgi:hypothetical protein